VGGLGQGQADEDRHESDHERDDAQVVDLDVAPAALDVGQQPADDGQGDKPDRQVDEEDPVPAEVVCEEPTEARADQEGDPEDRPEQALVLAPLGGREQVADDRQGDREERARAEALQAAEEDELPHRLAQARQHRADQEQDDPDQEQWPAAVQVRELAVDRHGDRARQQEDRYDPGVVIGALELGDDAGQDGTDDRLIEGGQEHAQQDRAEDLELGPSVKPECRVILQ
jgi:hypothetical protein